MIFGGGIPSERLDAAGGRRGAWARDTLAVTGIGELISDQGIILKGKIACFKLDFSSFRGKELTGVTIDQVARADEKRPHHEVDEGTHQQSVFTAIAGVGLQPKHAEENSVTEEIQAQAGDEDRAETEIHFPE
jgi:hypothetical protein